MLQIYQLIACLQLSVNQQGLLADKKREGRCSDDYFDKSFDKSWINPPFSNIGKRSVNSPFSLSERQENMRLIHCFHGLEKHR